MRRFTDLRNTFGERYTLFAGLDDVALEALYLGAQGWVSGLTNAFPRESVELVAAFGSCPPGSEGRRQLAWLTFFAVRRSLPCWDLYCDSDQPHRTLEVVRRWLAYEEQPERWKPYTRPVQPTYRGRIIVDCTYSDTRAVSEAVAALAHYCECGDPAQAKVALESADNAFRCSPLWYGDHFYQWIAGVALPTAVASAFSLW